MYIEYPWNTVVDNIFTLYTWLTFTVDFQRLPDFSDRCQCKPQCHRVHFGVTVSSTEIARNFASSVMLDLSQRLFDEAESSARIQDYISMDAVNRTWSEVLLRITKLYENIHRLMTNINTTVDEMIIELNDQSPNEMCDNRALSLIREAVTLFTTWEKQTYYMGIPRFTASCHRKEDFQTRLAHDIVRGHGHIEEFIVGLRQQIQRLKNSILSLNVCNGSAVQELEMVLMLKISGSNAVIDQMLSLYLELRASAQQHARYLSMDANYEINPVQYVR